MSSSTDQRGPPEDRTDRLVRTLFLAAVRDGHYNTVLALLDEGADPRQELALYEAASRGHLHVARLLMRAGADPCRDNDSALTAAAAGGHTQIVRDLLAAGCDPSVHDHGPLRAAEEHGHHETARALREAGSYNPDLPGDSPGARLHAELRRRSRPDP
jgi:ankyrin repeat protein